MIPNRTGAKTSDPRPVNLRNVVVFGEVCLTTGVAVSGVPTSPTLSTGAGAPTHTRPNGSVYMRTDGAADTTLYSRVSGAWVAIEATGGPIHIPDDEYIYFGDDDDGSLGYANGTDDLTLTVASADLELSTTTAGDVTITAADDVNIVATGSDVDIDAATLTVDLTGAASIDAVGASNLTTDNGNLTIQTTTAGSVVINGIGGLDIDTANALAMDVLGNGAINIAGTVDFDFGDAADITTTDITAGAATGATALIALTTGDRHLTDAAGSPVTGGMTIQTGESIVDNGAGAATGGQSGDLTIQTGDTNCDDATGTAGPSGALTIQTGDADSNAGTSGDSGILSLVSGFSDDAASGNVVIGSGTAGTDSGDVYIDVGAAGGTAGDIVIGTTATLITTGTTIKPRGEGGADAANALLMGVGTSGSPATTAVDNACFTEFRLQSTSTVGGYGQYIRYEGAGAGGEFIGTRSNTTLSAAAGNAHGSHDTLSFQAGGSVTGLATGRRTGLLIPDRAMAAGGTYYGELIEAYHEGVSSDISPVTLHAVLGVGVTGDLTGGSNWKYMIDFLGADGAGEIINTGVVATPANTACAVQVLVNGVARTLYLY